MPSIEQRLQKHLDFWAGRPLASPLTTLRVGDIFLSRNFEAAGPLLGMGSVVEPSAIDVQAFLADYERMYQVHESLAPDGFFVGEPCTGFPWLEAMCGCRVSGTGVSFVTRRRFTTIDELEALEVSPANPWYRKYLEFLAELARLSAGRFPLGQPILRGVTDTLGALVGQEEMACALLTHPAKVRTAFGEIVQLQRRLIEDAYRIIPPFHGGYSIGFYYLWAPAKVIWFQEDLAAILSPRHFDQYLRQTASEMCRGYEYTLVHLHPSAFVHLGGILSVPQIKAVQINKDDVGPGVADMLAECRRVLAADKRLVLLGSLDEADLDAIAENLPPQGIALHIFTDTLARAQALSAYIKARFGGKWGG
jgi:hypothetical protein